MEGYTIEPEAIAALSPYWTQHVNRFGIYDLDLERHPPTIDYQAPITSPTLFPTWTTSLILVLRSKHRRASISDQMAHFGQNLARGPIPLREADVQLSIKAMKTIKMIGKSSSTYAAKLQKSFSMSIEEALSRASKVTSLPTMTAAILVLISSFLV